jgi:hypothetical protein
VGSEEGLAQTLVIQIHQFSPGKGVQIMIMFAVLTQFQVISMFI